MPKTMANHRRSLEDPAFCKLLPIRDFLDDVMVRTDGSYVAAFRVAGALTYFADEDGRNETKELLEALLRTVPERSMRLQFRYEVVEGLNDLLSRYEDHRRTERSEALLLERHRIRQWSEWEREGDYLTRIAAVYLIWDPEQHRRMMAAAGGQQRKKKDEKQGTGFSLSVRKCIERTKKEHDDNLAEFESIVSGIQASLKSAGLGPERMSHREFFLEVKRSFNPQMPDMVGLRRDKPATRYISARGQASTVAILG